MLGLRVLGTGFESGVEGSRVSAFWVRVSGLKGLKPRG